MNDAALDRARALAVFPAGNANGEFGLPPDDLDRQARRARRRG